MNHSSLAVGEKQGAAWRAILAGGLICGTLDISAAFIDAGVEGGLTPPQLLRIVASGLLGAAAREGGWLVAAFGLGLHFCVAFSATIAFYICSRRFPGLMRHAVVSGLVYGAVVYAVMNLAVLPLAAQFRSLYIPGTKAFVPRFALIQFCIHLTCVGLAISLAVRRFDR